MNNNNDEIQQEYHEVDYLSDIYTAKVKNPKKTLIRLLTYILRKRLRFFLIILTIILSSFFTIAHPFLLGEAITELFNAMMLSLTENIPFVFNFNLIGNIIIILLVLYFLSAIFRYITEYFTASLSEEVAFELRQDISHKLNRLPLNYFDKNKKGEILSKATNDIQVISETLQNFISQLISSIIMLIGSLIMMLVIDIFLTLVALALFPIILLCTKFISKKTRSQFEANQQNIGKLNGHIEECYTGHTVILAYGMEDQVLNTFNQTNEKLYRSNLFSTFLSGIIAPITRFLNSIGYVIIAVVGGIFVINGRLPIGQIQAFISYSTFFGEPLAEGSFIWGMTQSTIAASERVFDFLDEQEELESGTKTITQIKGKVEFKNVSFGYSPNKILIQNINLKLNPGDKIAIVGPTGAGKTTMVNLLMGFYDVLEGEILIDDINIKDISKEHLRSMLGMVLQDTWLFNGTIHENIAYGKPNATKEEVVDAAKTAKIDHYIRTLPEGYDTILDEESSNISQGQKQLLTIARVILKNPPIIILDEATSNIDTRTEVQVQNSMDLLSVGHTSFVIAHRLSTIKDANIILVMKEGSIIEMGNHTDLLNSNGFYATLYNSQFNEEPQKEDYEKNIN